MIIIIIEVSALFLAVWPLLRLWHSRRLAPLFRKQHRLLAGLLIGWLLAVGALAVFFPALLHALTLLAVSTSAFLAWRARDSYGKSRLYPPGSLSLTQSLAAIADRNHYFEQAARHGIVFKMAQFHKPVVCIIGLERGFRLFREHRDALGPSEQAFNRTVKGGFLRYMDDRAHSFYGPLFMKALASKNLSGLGPRMTAVCQQTVDGMARDCAESAGSAVSPRAYCEQFAFETMLMVLFGLSRDMPGYHEMIRRYSGLETYPLSRSVSSKAYKSLEQVRQFLFRYSAGLQGSREGASPPCTLRSLHEIDPEMPDEVCIDNLVFILKLASGNVAGLLQWVFKMLSDNPEWPDRVRSAGDHPDNEDIDALADHVVNETLRLAQSEYLYRRLTKDVSFDGHTLPRGWLIRLCVRESHHSDQSFHQPDLFNPDRFAGNDFGTDEFSPFGYGKHACNGAQLTRMIARVFTRVLCTGFNFEIAGDGPAERDFRHWSHWRPSSRFKVKLVSRAPAQQLTDRPSIQLQAAPGAS